MGKIIHRPIDYASTGNYIAAGKPWDGLPSRPTVPDSTLVSGAVPNTPIPPSIENYRESLLFDAAAVQVHGALQSWRISGTPFNGANGHSQILAMPVTGLQQKILFAFEDDTTHSGNTWFTRSNDGSSWLAEAGMSPAFNHITDAAPGGPGTALLTIASPQYQYTTDFGQTWNNVGVGLSNSLSVHYGLGQYWLAQVGGLVYTANTPAGLGTTSTHPSLPIPGSTTFAARPEFADNGSNTICVVGTPVATVTYPSIYCSTNLGTSWVKAFDLTGAVAANIKYDPQRGLFITWDDTGSVSYSADGLTWFRGTAVTGNGHAAGLVIGARTFAVVGSAIVKLWSESGVGGQIAQGVAYSFDLGGSWYVCAFGSNSTPLKQLRAANNRLYAIDGFNLWISGVIASNDKDF